MEEGKTDSSLMGEFADFAFVFGTGDFGFFEIKTRPRRIAVRQFADIVGTRIDQNGAFVFIVQINEQYTHGETDDEGGQMNVFSDSHSGFGYFLCCVLFIFIYVM